MSNCKKYHYEKGERLNRTVSGAMLMLVLLYLLTFGLHIPHAKSEGTIYIRPDGTVDPPTSPIQRVGETYVFTDDIYNKSIEVQRNNITLDGNSHMLQTPKEFKSLFGVYLSGRKNVTITNIIISDGFIYGIWLCSSSNNKIVNNTLADVDHGIRLSSWSDHNFLINNTVMHTYEAISLEDSSYNILLSNKVMDNFKGLNLLFATQNTLRNNVMIDNKQSFVVGAMWLEYYIHDVDPSNTINGKPIYYWVNRYNETVPSDAACVVIVNSSRITVKNLVLKNAGFGVCFAYTEDSLIENVTVTESTAGIWLGSSDNNIINKNNLTANDGPGICLVWSNYNNVSYNIVFHNNSSGIWLEDTYYNTVIGNHVAFSRPGCPQEFDGAGILVDDSRYCTVRGNNVTRNTYGIVVGATPSRNNLIIENEIMMNEIGLILFDARSNKIYHNNFIDNTLQNVRTYEKNTGSIFDNSYPSGGNYWSDYNGADFFSGPYQNQTGSDGIGDTPYYIDENNVDRYPLMNPWGKPTPPTPPITNATISIHPKILNLESKGDWITAYIELADSYNVSDIDVSTITLNGIIPANLEALIEIGDYDNDSIPDLMVVFNETMLVNCIVAKGVSHGNITLVLSGNLYDRLKTQFIEYYIIRVSALTGDVNCDGTVNIEDIVEATSSYCTKEGDPNWNPNANYALQYDEIDIFDLVTIASHYGQTCP